MKDFINSGQWFAYQETPYRRTQPVKLDEILAARLDAFLRAKNVRQMSIEE